MTSTQLPWSTITLFTSYPPILRVTTKASSCGWMVPAISSFEKLNADRISTLSLFGPKLTSSAGSRATDIILEGHEPILPSAANMTLIVLIGGLEEAFPWVQDLDWSPCPFGRHKICCNLPSLTSYSKWFHSVWQSLVVCPLFWWYWQWRLWLHYNGSPLTLFGHLKYYSFLIFSNTWCTGSLNTVFTTWGAADLDCPVKSLWDLLLL